MEIFLPRRKSQSQGEKGRKKANVSIKEAEC